MSGSDLEGGSEPAKLVVSSPQCFPGCSSSGIQAERRLEGHQGSFGAALVQQQASQALPCPECLGRPARNFLTQLQGGLLASSGDEQRTQALACNVKEMAACYLSCIHDT